MVYSSENIGLNLPSNTCFFFANIADLNETTHMNISFVRSKTILKTKYQKINNKRQGIVMLIYLQLKMNFPRTGFPSSSIADESTYLLRITAD